MTIPTFRTKLYHLLPRRVKKWRDSQPRTRLKFKLLKSLIRPGDLVYDIGANVGEYPDILLRLGARGVAVEPQESCVQEWEHKFGSNLNAVIVPKGLAE